MSRLEAEEPDCAPYSDIIEVVVKPCSKDLGGFSVRRVLPASMVRRIGPFVFFDEMGPATFPPGEGINVRPHPHIGLATVTFLFQGEILHRDSLGYVQPIQPGAVNLMTAGKGIVHSERTSDELLASGQLLHGVQVWMALPEDQQEIEPAFVHYPAADLPVVVDNGVTTTIVIGSYNGQTSPVVVLPDTLYLSQQLDQGCITTLPDNAEQRGIYVVSGKITIDDCELNSGSMAVIKSGAQVEMSADETSRLVTIGGEDVGERDLWWNFVHSVTERIDQAKAVWLHGEFEMVPGDDEFIPLPEQ